MSRAPRDWLRLVGALSARATRAEAARALARALGAEDLIVFVRDPEVDTPLPALGFPQTLPEGRRWREFARRCLAVEGWQEERLAVPGAGTATRARGIGFGDGAALVLLGGEPRLDLVDDVLAALPLAVVAFVAERSALIGETHASLARARARELEAMATTLAEARTSLQDALAEQRQLVRTRDEEARRKDEFLAILAHELRNPLAALAAGAEVLRSAALPREAVGAVEVVGRQVATLARLVDDLLDLSRITRGALELRREVVDLVQVAARALDSARPLLAQHEHRVAFPLPPAPLLVEGDAVRLEQVVLNLLSNAARYTPPGGDVALLLGVHGDLAEVRVRDSGIGVEPEMLERIFDIFTQARDAGGRGDGGLGIGLTVSRRLAEMHGGTLTASSAGRGRGSEFVLRMKLADAATATEEAVRLEPPAVGAGLRVLVVDDNRDNAEMTAALVAAWGHDVQVAFDGEEALRRAAEFHPQVVVTDLGLPGLDGYAIAAALKAQPGAPRLIAMSGYGQDVDRDRTRAAGFDGHLLKPVDLDELRRNLSPATGSLPRPPG